jgi:hypothetical protein
MYKFGQNDHAYFVILGIFYLCLGDQSVSGEQHFLFSFHAAFQLKHFKTVLKTFSSTQRSIITDG